MDRRKLDFRDFDALNADLDRLHAGGYDRAGRWDLARACDHLGKMMRWSLEGFTLRAPWPVRVAGRFVVKPLVLWTRRLPAGVKAPADAEPTTPPDEAAAVAAIKALADRVRMADRFHPSPIFGPMPPDQWRQIHLIHAAHHLSFLIPRPAAD